MSPELWWIVAALMPLCFVAGRIHKRRIRGGQGYTAKQQLKRLAVVGVIFIGLALLAGLASGDTPQKPPPLASAVRGGKWKFSQKETALPGGPLLCTSHATIIGRHVTLKVAGAQMFEATLAIVRPQHKRGNGVSVFVDNEEFDSVQLQYNQPPHVLRVPVAGAQTLTLMEHRAFPSIVYCNITLS
jgi:hypothetical protein